ncbi:MAG: histidine kinase [Gammaproteobacteria bacterium]|nr:histidine kinase [Gammaproteobacteria bacterium]
MDTNIYSVVVKAIAKQKQISEAVIDRNSSLESLGVSSLDAITIVYEVEEILDIEIPNEALENLTTVQDILDGISQLVQSKA